MDPRQRSSWRLISADHYLPLLYVIATKGREDSVPFPVEGADGGSVSMLAVQIG